MNHLQITGMNFPKYFSLYDQKYKFECVDGDGNDYHQSYPDDNSDEESR